MLWRHSGCLHAPDSAPALHSASDTLPLRLVGGAEVRAGTTSEGRLKNGSARFGPFGGLGMWLPLGGGAGRS